MSESSLAARPQKHEWGDTLTRNRPGMIAYCLAYKMYDTTLRVDCKEEAVTNNPSSPVYHSLTCSASIVACEYDGASPLDPRREALANFIANPARNQFHSITALAEHFRVEARILDSWTHDRCLFRRVETILEEQALLSAIAMRRALPTIRSHQRKKAMAGNTAAAIYCERFGITAAAKTYQREKRRQDRRSNPSKQLSDISIHEMLRRTEELEHPVAPTGLNLLQADSEAETEADK